ncbi:hypothetical protein IMSHALPRED_005630 [Imshaugia aleurites]|uniref:Uncharacterized protein n=1 Tax=Imshaugia aleurites TaxID=172621 RepID=A0A8H3FGB5_9LECA|nr:hypothetical protein IMSHALPRED_005630 [Imshaugia aleurites]
MTALSRFALIVLYVLLPAISAQSANLTTASNAVQFRCTPLRIFDLRLGLVGNCAAAILSLPQYAGPVSFHRAGQDDQGRLPVEKTHGDCMVTVNVVDTRDFSSWTTVNLAASLLMTICTDISLNSAYTGGYAFTGDRAAIKVTLQRYEPSLAAGNGSGLLTE